jgi:hypothetical protein
MSIEPAKMEKMIFCPFIKKKLITYQLKIIIIVYFPKQDEFLVFLGL